LYINVGWCTFEVVSVKPLLIRQQLKFQLYYHWLLWVLRPTNTNFFVVLFQIVAHVPHHLLKVSATLLQCDNCTGTESSETVSYSSQKEHLYPFWPIEILIASFILVSFQQKPPHSNWHCKEWFFNTFSCRWFVRRQYQFYFVVCQPKLRLMESDYRKLQQAG
jgi:hypothetical protein